MNREELLFQLALTKPAHERAEFLDRECGGDAALRARMRALLAAHEESAGVLAEAAPAAVATMKVQLADPADEAVGQKIGRYKILEKVGEGGCGVVYVAEQTEPVRRRVALKVIKLGMDTKQVVARFEAERQALAMMDHPNIAKVLDAGTTDTGRPFFVMELVRGIKFTEYCDQNNLTTNERLELFIAVCHAIQHAHQKGIIHRDIKPSNILVTLHDGVPVPKVIDFGIAKATEGRLTDATVYTQLHQFIGTPAYMSPEQAEMSGLDVDTRSDIYSLGVLLYELLTGKTPFDAQELMSKGIDAMRKTIREEEPARPSTKLATLQGDELTTTAKRRSIETSKLAKLLRGDLDWIVMKCLEKDRTRRYETANGLAADLQRHLSNEPVVACPPSAAYRIQKSFRRNKLAFAAATAVSTVLVVGILGSTWQAVRATRAQREAVEAKRQADDARKNEAELRVKAESNEQKAETEATRSAQVAQFMRDMLKGVGPSVALGRDTALLREILDQTAQRLDTLKVQPEVESDLYVTLGGVYRDLGDYPKAGAMLQQALAIRKKLFGEKSVQVAAVLDVLGQVQHRAGQSDEAEAAYRQALAIREELLGHESLEVASSLNHLGSLLRNENKRPEAEADLREGLALRKRLLPPDDPEIANSLSDLGIVLGAEGKAAEAEPMHREALALRRSIYPSDHPLIADSLLQLGGTLDLLGNYAEAETNLLAALAIQQKVLGDHRDTANTLDRLGSLLVKENRLPEAERRFREALAMRNKVFGESATTSDRLIDVLNREGKQVDLGNLYKDQMARWNRVSNENRPPLKLADSLVASGRASIAAGKPDEGVAAYHQAMEIHRSYSGDAPIPGLLRSLSSQLRKAGQTVRSEAASRELLDVETKLHGRESTNAVLAMYGILLELNSQGKFSEAETIGREAQAIQKQLKSDDRMVGAVLEALGQPLRGQGKQAEAEACYREAIAHPATSPNTEYYCRRNLGDMLMQQSRYAEAETQFRATVEHWSKGMATPPNWPWAVYCQARALRAQDKPVEAEACLRAAFTNTNLTPGCEYWLHQGLGELLMPQKHFVEAEAEFRAAVKGWNNQLASPSYHEGSVNDLASALQAQNKNAEAEALYREQSAGRAKQAGDADPAVVRWRISLGRLLRTEGKPDEAKTMFLEAGKSGNPQVLNDIAWQLAISADPALRDGSNAVVLAGQAVAATSRTNAPFLDTLAAACAETGQFDQAVAAQKEAIAVSSNENEKRDFATRLALYQSGMPYRDHLALADYVNALLDAGKFSEAEAPARECLALREKLIPDEWRAFNAKCMLGGSLLGQKKYAEAEPLLLAGYEGMRQRAGNIPVDAQKWPREALERLVQLYEATGQTAKAAEWRAKQVATNPPAAR